MVGHGGSSAGLHLTDPTSPIPSHCASIVATSTLRVNLAFDELGLFMYFFDLTSHSLTCLLVHAYEILQEGMTSRSPWFQGCHVASLMMPSLDKMSRASRVPTCFRECGLPSNASPGTSRCHLASMIASTSEKNGFIFQGCHVTELSVNELSNVLFLLAL